MWENMIFIFIDSVLLAALIFGGLATGAGIVAQLSRQKSKIFIMN